MSKKEKVRKCTECKRPVTDWPMCFRGDPVCSVICEKSAEKKRASE